MPPRKFASVCKGACKYNAPVRKGVSTCKCLLGNVHVPARKFASTC